MRADDAIGGGGELAGRDISRRTVFAGLVAATTVGSGVAMAASGEEKIKAAADQLAASMQAVHGGSWIVHIDHDSRVVCVFPELP
jgi:hypothetical protein